MRKGIIAFLFAVSVSTVAAYCHWNDYAHLNGTIKADGDSTHWKGRVPSGGMLKADADPARRPVALEGGVDRCVLKATVKVAPPYRGDVRIAVEGNPKIACEIYPSHPLIDLGVHSWPGFKDNILSGLTPNDRLTLWIRMKPAGASGKYRLAFYDTGTGKSVLNIPLTFNGKQETSHAGHDCK